MTRLLLIATVVFFATVGSADEKIENLQVVLQRIAAFHKIYTLITKKDVQYSVSSTIRDKAHNERAGGAPGSAHLTGQAVDIIYNNEFLSWLRRMSTEKPNNLSRILRQVGLYLIDGGHKKGYVHYTTRKPDSSSRVFQP